MEETELLKQTAQATEEHLISMMKINSRLLDDLKLLAKHTWIKTFQPGELAANVIDKSIEKFGHNIDDDTNIDMLDNAVNDGDLKVLKNWVDTAFSQHELYLLDLILWKEMNFMNN